MKIDHLRYFVHFAHSSSINAAAKELYISQQQLNRILTSLERELGVTLFIRSKNGIEITKNGRQLLMHAIKIISDYSEMENYFSCKKTMSDCSNDTTMGHVILYVPIVFSIFLNDFTSKFKEIVPHVHLTCIEDSQRVSIETLTKEGLHFVNYQISFDIPDDKMDQLVVEKVGSFELFVIVSKESDYAFNSDFDITSDFHNHLSTLTPDMPFEPPSLDQISFISSNIEQHIESVITDETIFCLPGFALSKLQKYTNDLVILPVKGGQHYQQSIIYPATYKPTDADFLLIEFLKTYLKNLNLYASYLYE